MRAGIKLLLSFTVSQNHIPDECPSGVLQSQLFLLTQDNFAKILQKT